MSGDAATSGERVSRDARTAGDCMSGEIFTFAGGARALFTTRAEGNLSTLVGPDAECGLRAREALRGLLGLDRLVHARQVHGTTVQRVGDGPAAVAEEADGHATALPGVGVMVLVADCLPVILASDGAVAALHTGWRGLADGVLEEGVRALREVGGVAGVRASREVRGVEDGRGDRSEDARRQGDASGGDPPEITAVIGPGAGVCCYEVGEEVHAAFGGAHPHRAGRHIDLRAIARERLLAAGVSRVEDLDRCTICDVRYFSHRREAAAAGRQAGVAWLSS